ncbi:PIN domain-containing protein [Streptomyces sp. NPDC020817]|uniref:PIN domain-containing protein n=1 Tax=Streptomyces sp. NPDC020817 TaxID=3365095 RepID=UPI0037955937
MEVLHSARSAAEAERLSHLLSGFDHLPCTDEVGDRAKEIQRLAPFRVNHRALSMADALIATTAERHGRTVLHYDATTT